MGKLIVEFLIPALIVVALVWQGLKIWYFKFFGKSLAEYEKFNDADKKYNEVLNNIKK